MQEIFSDDLQVITGGVYRIPSNILAPQQAERFKSVYQGKLVEQLAKATEKLAPF